jgi:hypothetical protein
MGHHIFQQFFDGGVDGLKVECPHQGKQVPVFK